MGSASATINHYDYNMELSEQFTLEEFNERYDGASAWNYEECRNFLDNSDFFSFVKANPKSRLKDVYNASKVGSFDVTVHENLWIDPDVYHFHINPHKSKLDIDPYMDDGRLRDPVYYSFDDPRGLCDPTRDYLYFATCKVLVQDWFKGTANIYDIRKAGYNKFDPCWNHIPLNSNTTYVLTYLIDTRNEEMNNSSLMKVLKT
jgi:hypothetical protein